jgi:hypothetical protein
MTEISMNKVIHSAVRRDLNRFISALSTAVPGDTTRANQLNTAWVNFDDQLTRHHQDEHAIAWPALEQVGVSKELLASMDAEHDTMAKALSEARTAMAAYGRTAGAQEAQAALAAVQGLQAVTIKHLDHEEAELEDVYMSKRDTPEIKAMGRAFGKVSPATGGRFFAWVLDDAGPDERAAISRDVPGPVITIIGGVFGRGYRKNIAPVWQS